MLTCREVAELLDLYLDGELKGEQGDRLLHHLRECPSCARLLSHRIQETELIMNSLPVPELSPGFKAGVMARLTESRAQRPWFPSLKNLLTRPWLGPALACLILLVTVIGAFSLESRPEPPQQNANRMAAGKTSGTLLGKSAPAPHPGLSEAATKQLQKQMPHGRDQLAPAAVPEKKAVPRMAPLPPPSRGKAVEQLIAPGRPARSSAVPAATVPAGYVLFFPGFLPPGYSLVKVIYPEGAPSGAGMERPAEPKRDSQPAEDKVMVRGAHPTQPPLVLVYLNGQTGQEIQLEIIPREAVATAGEPGNAGAPDARQPAGAGSLTWDLEKDGMRFTLTLSGSLSPQELQKVADSIR